MKIVKSAVAVVLVLGVCLFMLCACSVEGRLVGEWELVEGNTSNKTIRLRDDATCMVNGSSSATWGVEENMLRIEVPMEGLFMGCQTVIGSFTLEGDTLRIIDPTINGSEMATVLVYQKVK